MFYYILFQTQKYVNYCSIKIKSIRMTFEKKTTKHLESYYISKLPFLPNTFNSQILNQPRTLNTLRISSSARSIFSTHIQCIHPNNNIIFKKST